MEDHLEHPTDSVQPKPSPAITSRGSAGWAVVVLRSVVGTPVALFGAALWLAVAALVESMVTSWMGSPDLTGAVVSLALVTFTVLLACGVLDRLVVGARFQARALSPGERVLLAPTLELLVRSGFVLPRRLLVKTKDPRNAGAIAWGHHTMLIHPVVLSRLQGGSLTDRQVAGLLGWCAASQEVCPSRFESLRTVLGAPVRVFTVVAMFFVNLVTFLVPRSLKGQIWKFRILISALVLVATYHDTRDFRGHETWGWVAASVIAFSYLPTWVEALVAKVNTKIADNALVTHGLGRDYASYLATMIPNHLNVDQIHRLKATTSQEGTIDWARWESELGANPHTIQP